MFGALTWRYRAASSEMTRFRQHAVDVERPSCRTGCVAHQSEARDERDHDVRVPTARGCGRTARAGLEVVVRPVVGAGPGARSSTRGADVRQLERTLDEDDDVRAQRRDLASPQGELSAVQGLDQCPDLAAHQSASVHPVVRGVEAGDDGGPARPCAPPSRRRRGRRRHRAPVSSGWERQGRWLRRSPSACWPRPRPRSPGWRAATSSGQMAAAPDRELEEVVRRDRDARSRPRSGRANSGQP